MQLDLDNLRARMLAIVSVEGGPTRESLDNVHTYLQDAMRDDTLDGDELAEYIADQLQDRHHFLVDILLHMVLLEEELAQLLAEIDSFSHHSSNADALADDVVSVELEGSESADNEVIRSLINEEELQASLLAERLQHERNGKLKALQDRLEKKRLSRIQELEKSGMTTSKASTVVETEMAVDNEVETRKISDAETQEMQKFYADSLSRIRKAGEVEADRLSDELQAQKNAKLAKLKERLEKRKLGTSNELTNDEVLLVTNDEFKNLYAEASAALLSTESKEAERLMGDLKRQQDKAMAKLRARLDKRCKEDGVESLSNEEAASISSESYAGFYDQALSAIKATNDREAGNLSSLLESKRNEKLARLRARLDARASAIDTDAQECQGMWSANFFS